MDKFLKGLGKQKVFATLIGFVIILFVVEMLPWKIFSPTQKILLPVQIAIYKTRKDVDNFLGTFADIKALREKENQLTEENALLLAENATLKRLKNENKTLKTQLGVLEQKHKLIVASVIGQDPLLSSSRLLIDKGESDGVKNKALVLLKDILVGQIKSVGQYSSTVQLVTDSETKIPAITAGGVRGLLQGEFGNKMSLTKVVQNKDISKDEIIFTSGEAGFPKNMVLGKITKVEKDPAQLFQKAQVSSLIEFDSLDILFITESKK
jgi:rod shape-determining protein MreC